MVVINDIDDDGWRRFRKRENIKRKFISLLPRIGRHPAMQSLIKNNLVHHNLNCGFYLLNFNADILYCSNDAFKFHEKDHKIRIPWNYETMKRKLLTRLTNFLKIVFMVQGDDRTRNFCYAILLRLSRNLGGRILENEQAIPSILYRQYVHDTFKFRQTEAFILKLDCAIVFDAFDRFRWLA